MIERLRRIAPASTTITSEGRTTRRNLELTVAVLVAVAFVGWAIAEFGNNQAGAGPNGSMFVTADNGTAALAELLEARANPVTPAVAPLIGLDPGGTVFIIDPAARTEYSSEEIESLTGWVESGGRLIVAGRPHPDLTGTVLPDDLRLGFSGTDPVEIVRPIRGVDGTVETDGVYSVATDADGTSLLGASPMAMAFSRDQGEVIYVADSSIFWNLRIEANAPWVVSLVQDGSIRFDEVRHGYEAPPVSESSGSLLAALPPDIRAVVWLLAPVMVIWLIVYGRRLGPPELRERELAPPRRELVDAVAGLLARMPDPVAAAEPVKERLREAVARAAGLPDGADDAAIVEAAVVVGVDADQLVAALDASSEEAMIQAQHLLATLSERERL